jgi:DNA polymerase-3 subunit delta'
MSLNGGAPYPWLDAPWRQLLRYRQEQRMPQAVLLAGRQGIGKRRLAEAFAALLLCRQPGELACGECSSCRLWAAETHPDYLPLLPAEPGKAIGIDAVRQLIDKLSLKPQYSQHRVVLLDPAHALNSAAANALLKTLEEPPPQTLMLLLSALPSQMPATLVSRCQRLPIAPPARAAALAWLQGQAVDAAQAGAALAAANGAPLLALAVLGEGVLEQRARLFALWPALAQGRVEVVQAAEKLAALPLETLLDWLYGWAGDVLKLSLSAPAESLANQDLLPQLQSASQRLPRQRIESLLEVLQQAKRQLLGNAQLNRQLLLEDVLIAWQRLARPVA